MPCLFRSSALFLWRYPLSVQQVPARRVQRLPPTAGVSSPGARLVRAARQPQGRLRVHPMAGPRRLAVRMPRLCRPALPIQCPAPFRFRPVRAGRCSWVLGSPTR
ncbi:hypothetical protein AO501_06150 [Mycobacterium gordonae]|uniref:Uncharacterized protein n=1 Tax=Mycobacterium gordonae TaxID=1778 RepID=A0A0Q2S0Q2_MYCGO|nr:hypothetical protein AO501_06150 [Mycobacterium gordonae]